MARPSVLVGVNRIPGLSSTRRIDDTVEIGATVRHSRLVEQTEHPLLSEFARRHGDFALVTAVVTEVRDRPRITFGGVGSVPHRATAAEQALADGRPAAEVAHIAADEIEPTADLHGSVEFRRAIAAEMTRRALAQFDSVRERC